ncbi:MAG: protein kinase domain-containing protein [Phocaeicola sp.]
MIGKEILNYTIVSVIGKGGMGTVYLAEHKYIKLQKAAIKVINGGMVNSFTRQRLAEEAEYLARLNHNHIVRFLNYHIDESNSVYLIMEYAEGITLDKFINEVSGLIVENRIYPFFAPILDAVGYAHKHGVIHRDLKPNNIIITQEESAKILDFGIACIMNKEGDENPEEKLIMGTPAYMSPEQVKGEKLDARSDIYSLGVLLYQMLTGNAPYDTTTLSEYDINKKVVEESLPKMSLYYKYISEKLQKIVDKATAKNPKERYQSCAEFKKALHQAIYPPKVAKWVKMVAAISLFSLLGGGGYLWDYHRIKTYYYKDYVEQWGIPQGIGELASNDRKASNQMYRFEYCKRKLQRVSHVNSVGVLIEEHESERSERPIDMLFTYAPNGKVSKVKVKDCSEKVLYIKAYNDKLNTLIFQYDDAYGTEKTLAAQTIGDVNALTDTGGDKRQISRWLLTYNENGYVSNLAYATFQNVLVGDANNIYGRNYSRDSKGRIIEEIYLGKDGERKSTNWGLGMKRFFYDDKDNFVKSEYYTTDGKPALDQFNGTNAMVKNYDKHGNAIAEYYQDHDGNRMLPKSVLVAGFIIKFDEQGFVIQRTAVGIDNQPCYTKYGYSIINIENNEFGHISQITYLDIEQNPCYSTKGNASEKITTDKSGNTLSSWSYDIEGNLIENSDGRAGYVAEYDQWGNTTKIVNYGIDQKPVENKYGAYGWEWEYNELGLETKVKCLGKDLNYAPDKYGSAVTAKTYDKAGNLIRTANETADGKQSLLHGQYCGVAYLYNEGGYQIERSYFNEKNEPCKGPNGYAKVTYEYDSNGFNSSMNYYDSSNKRILYKGIAGQRYTRDERGNITKQFAIDEDGNQSTARYEVRQTFDKNDNLLTTAYYEKGKPIKNGYHKIGYAYNSRNQKVATKFYDVQGKLVTKNDDKYAIEKNEYDLMGNVLKTSFYGVDEKPIECKNGWASVQSIYNVMGQIVKNIYYNINGVPASTTKCLPIVEYKYDKWGNITYFAIKNGEGKLYIPKEYEYAIYRRSYDARGNEITDSYFDQNDKPIVPKNGGYHLMKCEFDRLGNRKSISFFDTKGEAMISSTSKCHKLVYGYDKRNNWLSEAFYNEKGEAMLVNKYHKQVNSYNAENQIIECKYYNKDDKPVNNSYGYHKVQYSYKSNGDSDKLKTYNLAGGIIDTYSWDGYEWQIVKDWRDEVKSLSDSLPYDYGEEYGNIMVKSIKVTGNKHCTIIFTIPQSKSSISEDDLTYYKDFAVNVSKTLTEGKEFRYANIKVTVLLYDVAEQELYSKNL